MLQVGGEAERRRPWPSSGPGAAAIAGALAVAAALTVAGIVAQIGSFGDAAFGDRVILGVLSSNSAMGLVLAATVALSWSDRASVDLASRPRARIWIDDSTGVIALAVAAASCWAFVDALVRDFGGEGAPHPELQRFALASASLAPLFLAVAAIVVIARARGRVGPTDASETAGASERDVFAQGLVGPTVGCLLGAGLVSLAIAVTEAFTQNGASFWSRVTVVSVRAGDATTAFLAFAVIVLVVLGYRDRARSGAALRLAAFIGGLVTVGAAYALYRLVIAGSHSGPADLTLGTVNWWIRLARIAATLAAAVLGVVVITIARQLRTPDRAAEPPPWAPREPEQPPGPIVAVSRTGARTVATMLAVSTAAYAAYTVLILTTGLGFAVNDLIVQVAPFILIVTGLALAAALVMSASRPDVSGRDTLNDLFDGFVGLIAVAALAVSGYSICFVIFGRHTGRLSVLAHAGTAQRLQDVGTSIAAVLIAAAAIHLIVRGRQLGTDEDTVDEVEALDLLS